MGGRETLFDKIWKSHVIKTFEGGRALIHVDRHLLHEGTSGEPFANLRKLGIAVRRPDLTYAVIDHGLSTLPGRTADSYEPTRARNQRMQNNCREANVELIEPDDPRHGIVHVVSTELGIALPGSTLVCGDSHTATSGGLGAWAWGVGASEIQKVLATQALILRKPKTMRVRFEGRMAPGVTPKDLTLYLIGRHGTAAGTGYVIQYAGSAIDSMPIEGRCTICNMSIELGARSGLIAADDSTYEYLHGRPHAPKGAMWDRALDQWRALNDCEGAVFDLEIVIDCADIQPQISWGNSPQDVIAVSGRLPHPERLEDAGKRASAALALSYMGLEPGAFIEGLPIDYAFIGSCTNGRLSDIAAAAEVVKGRKVAEGVQAIVVPGSLQVKAAAEAMGLDAIFKTAGFQWRESGCSMCIATNGDFVPPGARCISTSNRNFEDRQGSKSRTHLASPMMVAAAAVSGHIVDVRKLMTRQV